MGYDTKAEYYWELRGCAGCHNAIDNPAFFNLAAYSTYQALVTKIQDTMPLGAADGCIDECATEVAGYIENSRNSDFVYPFPEVTAQTIISEGFEDGVVGEDPEGWSLFMGWNYYEPGNPSASYNASNDGNYARVDDTRSYSGSKSVHFLGGSSPSQIVKALPAGTDVLYLKAMVYMTKKLGNEAGDNHEHIMGTKGTTDANNEIRFGQIKGHIGTNDVPSDNIAPTMEFWESGPEITADAWHCVELELRADMAYDTVNAWVDDVLVHTVDEGADWNNGALAADWMTGKLNYVMFGFHSFSGNTADVWMDDIAVSTEARIGCN